VLSLSGIPKTFLLVLVDMAMFDSSMSFLQAVGFTIAGVGTYHYSRISKPGGSTSKSAPKVKEDPARKEDEESHASGGGYSEK
jgi:hypothetical protein